MISEFEAQCRLMIFCRSLNRDAASSGHPAERRQPFPTCLAPAPVRCVAGSSRRDVGRACGCGRVCNTRPGPAVRRTLPETRAKAGWQPKGPEPRPRGISDEVGRSGQYVGTYMAWGVHNSGWRGEGEIKFYMDGDREFP